MDWGDEGGGVGAADVDLDFSGRAQGHDDLTQEEAAVLRELGYWCTGYWCKKSASNGGHVSELLVQISTSFHV